MARMQVTRETRWATPCEAYNVQLSLCDASELPALQAELARCCPLPLHLVPRASFHVSVFSLIHFSWVHPDKRGLWRALEAGALAALTPLVARPPLALRFSRLRVTENALIALADDEANWIASVRSALAGVTAAHAIPTRRYDVVHTTLARFAQSGQLSRHACGALEALSVDVPYLIPTLQIVRETTYPTLAFELLRELPLAGSVRD
jgi:hypothetical protein